MADYKALFTETLNTVIGKAKDVAVTVADTVSENGGVKGIYEQGTVKAKAYSRIAKISLEVAGENEELKKVYAEIGRLCYEQYKDDPCEAFAALFAQAAEISAKIADKQAEIQALKEESAPVDADIDVEIEQFEDVVDATAAEAAETVEAAAEEAAEAVEEVIDEVKE